MFHIYCYRACDSLLSETSEQESYSDRGQLGGRLQGVAEIENPLNGIGTKVTRGMFTTEGGQEGPHNDGQPEDIQNKGQLDWLESCCLNNPGRYSLRHLLVCPSLMQTKATKCTLLCKSLRHILELQYLKINYT